LLLLLVLSAKVRDVRGGFAVHLVASRRRFLVASCRFATLAAGVPAFGSMRPAVVCVATDSAAAVASAISAIAEWLTV